VVSNPDHGQANIDLGDDYQLCLNENNSEMKLINKHTGECSDIWGDPHFDFKSGGADQHREFWGPVTLHLQNGTQITINTTPWKGNPNATLSTQLTITQGNRAIVVTGLDQNTTGDLSITQSNNGRCLDATTPHGMDLYEGHCGSGWLDSCGNVVSQAEFDAAKNAPVNNLSPAFQAMGLLLVGFVVAAVGAEMASHPHASGVSGHPHHPYALC
jgi:hypothetical protein